MKREILDPYWHGARIAARLWLKARKGKPLSLRDKRLAGMFAEQKGVSNRLIEQARSYVSGPFRLQGGFAAVGCGAMATVARQW